MASAAAATQSNSGTDIGVGNFLTGIFRWLLMALKWVLVIGILLLVVLFLIGKFRTGSLGSSVEHAQVGAEESASPFISFIKESKIFAPVYYAFNPEASNPYAIDPEVETNEANQDLGLEIVRFEPTNSFFNYPDDPPLLQGTVRVRGLEQPMEVHVSCSLDDYTINKGIIPGEIVNNPAARGNTITIQPDQTTEFGVNCYFPGEITELDKIQNAKTAKLIVVYEFTTKSYQRIWVLDNEALADLNLGGVNPFEVYQIDDPLLSSDRKLRSKTTAGPMKLGLAVDAIQPLTSGTRYTLFAELSRAFTRGDLQQLNYLTVQVPSVETLELALAGEQESGLTSGRCDFEFLGTAPGGFKEYGLIQSRIEETNQECNQQSLRELAISENECISAFKNPKFSCNFVLTKTPFQLESDIITASANYVFKVDRQAVVDIYNPQESQLVA